MDNKPGFMEQLDEEWIELIMEALEAGISPECIRNFLRIRSENKANEK